MIEYQKISDKITEDSRISYNVAESDNIKFPIYQKISYDIKEHQRISVNVERQRIENISEPQKISRKYYLCSIRITK